MEKRLQDKIDDYYQLAQYHMKLAHIMRKHNQHKAVFYLCHSALISMIRALYIYENKTEMGSEITLIDLLLLLHTDYNPALEIVVFIGELNYIVNGEGQELEVIKTEDINRVIIRAKEVLSELCRRLKVDPY
jgi:HEPN domain-containing protein